MALAFQESCRQVSLGSFLNDLSSRTQEMISRDHKFGGSSKQNSEKCSSSLSAIHSNESVVTLKVITL